jgi:biotin operon repressor
MPKGGATMIERWYKAPVNCLFDVRIARMPAGLFRAWHQMLALASLNGGALPSVDQIAFSLRSSAATILKRLQALADRGLAILKGESWGLVDPQARDEDAADAPLTGAERTRRWRERKAETGAASCDADVTAGDAAREEKTREENIDRAERHADSTFSVAAPATSPQPAQSGGFWIAQGAPGWEPWADFWRTRHGKSPPTDRRGGWRFPSRSPPALAAE